MKYILRITLLLSLALCTLSATAQSDLELITAAVNDYIEGTANGQPERLTRSFDPDFQLYHVKDNKLETWSGQKYIDNIKSGHKSGRIGRIIMIDYEGSVAIAKVEIDIPSYKRIYTDYLMLLKYDNRWKIVHKSFAWNPYVCESQEGNENEKRNKN